MATGKVSLRQKMINMMYLVLLAILALNVSAEVLKAFYKAEVSMEKTGQNIDAKNALLLNSFAALMKTQPANTKEWNDKALEGKKINDEFIAYVEQLKALLEEEGGGRKIDDDGNKTELKKADNTEVHANIMLNQGKGAELKERINATRDKLLALVPAADRNTIKSDLYTPDNGEQSWESANFESMPLAAVMTSLTKTQNDCKNTYSDVLNILYSKTSTSLTPIDKLKAVIMPKSNSIMSGEKFEAEVFLAAYDSKQPNEIEINGKGFNAVDGVVQYSVPTSGQGEYVVNGNIKVKERDGEKLYPFTTTYSVFGGFAAVSAEKMNMFYIGLDNPISISVPGFPTDRVNVSIENGVLKHLSNNKYNVVVANRGQATIKVSVRMDDGSIKNFGSYTFRVRNVPKPYMQLGTLKPGRETKSTITSQSRLFSTFGPEFAYEGINISVNSYRCTVAGKSVFQQYNVTGANLTQEIKNAINSLKPGEFVVFSDIQVTGPSGTPKPDDMTFIVK